MLANVEEKAASVEAAPEAPHLSLVMPCYNEEELVEYSITQLLEAFSSSRFRVEIIAVDNGSRDRTAEILQSLADRHPQVKPVRVERNEGYGHGILCGLPSCRADWVGVVCADGQVDAVEVVKLLDMAVRARTPHLVKVRRRFRMDGLRRKFTSIVYNGLTTVLFGGLGSIDINGNPKILPRDFLRRMNLKSKDWFLDAEIMIKAKGLGLKVMEVNVFAVMRAGGQSHVRVGTCWEFIVNLLRCRFNAKGQVDRQLSRTTDSAVPVGGD